VRGRLVLRDARDRRRRVRRRILLPALVVGAGRVPGRLAVRDLGSERGDAVHGGQLLRDNGSDGRHGRVQCDGRLLLPAGPVGALALLLYLYKWRMHQDVVSDWYAVRVAHVGGRHALHGGQLLLDHGHLDRHGHLVRVCDGFFFQIRICFQCLERRFCHPDQMRIFDTVFDCISMDGNFILSI
jgi:hypothetical protein